MNKATILWQSELLVSVFGDTTIIKSKYHFLLALSLVVTIIMSVVMVACNNVNAQTLPYIMEQRKAFENNPQIMVGSQPDSIAVNYITNKIYVTNSKSGTVSVIDSNSGSTVKNTLVGEAPGPIAVDSDHNKIYVINRDSKTVSVINGNNDNEIRQISVGKYPNHILVTRDKIYVSNGGDNTVSVISTSNDNTKPYVIAVGKDPTYMARDLGPIRIYVSNGGDNTVSVINASNPKNETHVIAVGQYPSKMAVDPKQNKIYVANINSNTVSVINASNPKNETHVIPVGFMPISIASDYYHNKTYVANFNNTISIIDDNNDSKIGQMSVGLNPEHMIVGVGKIYVSNTNSNTVSVYDVSNRRDAHREPHVISVGKGPTFMAVSPTNVIYVANTDSNTVSVIDGFSDKVAAGVTLNVHPANSGKIICNNQEYPTNIYLYVDAGTKCTSQQNKDSEFSGWVENLNGNSTIPLGDSSGNLTVNRYGTFTANFIPIPPHPSNLTQFLLPLYAIIASSLFGWSIPSIMSWVKAKMQRMYLKKCINQIGKLDRNTIEKKITEYYVDGKISESHRQLLKDKISEYYEKVKDYDDTIDY